MSLSSIRLGQPAGPCGRLELAAVLPELRLDVGQAKPLIDLLLGGAGKRPAGRVVEDPVLGDVQPAPDGRLAAGRRCARPSR